MNRINIGTKVSPLGIPKVKLSANDVRRAVLIDPNPMFKYVAYDEAQKCRVEVDQEAVIKYGLRPMTTYYYLVALMNTDRLGNVVPGPIEIQYLQLSENTNNDFADAVRNMSSFSSIQLNAVEKVAQGKVFSYVKPIPSDAVQIPQDVLAQIDKLRNTPGAIDAMWRIIDSETSITVAEYERRLANPENSLPAPNPNPQIPQAPSSPMLNAGQGYQQQPAQPTYSGYAQQQAQPAQQQFSGQPAPAAQPAPVDNDFGAGDDFGEGFDQDPM